MPERMRVYDLELAYKIWTWLEATDWHWPPDVLLRQPESLMEDLVQVAWLARQVEKHLGNITPPNESSM